MMEGQLEKVYFIRQVMVIGCYGMDMVQGETRSGVILIFINNNKAGCAGIPEVDAGALLQPPIQPSWERPFPLMSLIRGFLHAPKQPNVQKADFRSFYEFPFRRSKNLLQKTLSFPACL